jgi:predicted CXXCH cytochrome family protein
VKKRKNLTIILFVLMLSFFKVTAQISPGDLSNAHAKLEGISNCTQCHVLGNKVSSDKCLTCHTEIKERITLQKGYHSSTDVKGKDCFSCHSEHNGKNFQLIRFDSAKFDHNLTGYTLSVPHAKKDCKDCHSTKYIADQKIKGKKYTYLGVIQECLTCHADYHQKTLSAVCLICHNPDAFKPATKFNHNDLKFQLDGKHVNVACINCHKVDTIDGKKFQQFRLGQSVTCSSCHKDPHQNKFGPNCGQCHTVESFQIVKGGKDFDHNKTSFRLEEKHINVNCKACHKTKFTDPVRHARCTDCHSDYHKNQFAKNGVSPDCSQCHSVKGFTLFSYTIDQHEKGTFPLQGAHLATPCFDCHQKQKDWSFKGIGINCKDCHKNIHKEVIEAKLYPEENCRICHNEDQWADISFDHTKTAFDLTGAHKKVDCRTCHFKVDIQGTVQQKFSGLSKDCTGCHTDEHYKQFEVNGITNCMVCHDTENWKASKFNHNNTAFRLDGKHINVPCGKCHKPQQEGSYFYVRYKIEDYKCESCHS